MQVNVNISYCPCEQNVIGNSPYLRLPPMVTKVNID